MFMDLPSPNQTGPRPPWAGERMRLQRLVNNLTTRLLAAEPNQVDAVVVEALREVAAALHLECAVLWQTATDRSNVVASHSWMQGATAAPPAIAIAAFPFTSARLAKGDTICFARVNQLPDPNDRRAFRRHGLRAAAIVPVLPSSTVAAAIAFGSTTGPHEWPDETLDQLRAFARVIGQAPIRCTTLELRRPHVTGTETIDRRSHSATTRQRIVAESPAIQRTLELIEQVAATPSTALLLGETGVGKEVLAQTIHELSTRRDRQMIRVSCAAMPSTLIESELFGRERGAFTGADSRQIGRFEAANNSTLFLDEIGELSAEVQVKLLRVLQERVFERLGSTQSIKVDARIIAATHRNVEKAVQNGTFREDLYYRLNVFPIVVPALRDRVEDIPGLVWQLIDQSSLALGKTIEAISKESMRQMQRYTWPGNVRELRNVIERAVILCRGPVLQVQLPERAMPSHMAPAMTLTLRDLEIQHIRATLERTHWRIRGFGGAAESLGLKPTTLETRMAKLGIFRPARSA